MTGKGYRSIVSVLLILASAAGAGSLASMSQGDIRFGIDTALFDYAHDQETLGIEVYQQIAVDQFSMDIDSMVGFETLVVLRTEAGDTVAVDQWFSEVEWMDGRSIVNSSALPAVPGDYILDVVVTDSGNGRQGTVSRPLTVTPVGYLSELELARALVPAPEGSVNPLLKGGLLVFPAANGSFMLPGEHILYYYVELYDVGGESVRLQSRLENASGETIFARPWTSVTVPEGASIIALVDSLDLQVVRGSGLHRVVLGMVVQDDTLEVEKLLMVGRTVETLASQGDSTVTGEATELLYPGQFALLLSDQEMDIFESLDEAGKVRFYSTYWLGMSDERLAFEQRCMGSERYSGTFREGWETDRGRVYVVYGAPDDIESVPFNIDQIPHEIWYYFEGGNDRFVFADRTGTGDFEQIFSTVEGETSYSNWEDMLAPVTAGGGFGGLDSYQE